jgi:hypothetical protein
MKKSSATKSKAKAKPTNVVKPANEPAKGKTKKAKSPNATKKAKSKSKSKSPQTNVLTPNNFEEAYRAMGVGMTRAQFKAQY